MQGVLQHDEQQRNVAKMLDQLLQQLVQYDKDMGLYYAKLYNWERKRHQLRQQLLSEEAKKEARQQLEKKTLEEQKGSVIKWFFRWYKQAWQLLLQNEEISKLHKHGEIQNNFMRKKKKRREVEPGAGRMVACIDREKKLDLLCGTRPTLPAGPKGFYLYGNVGCGKTMLMDMLYNAVDGVVKHRRRLHFHGAMLEVHDRMHKLWRQQLEEKVDFDIPDLSFDESEFNEAESMFMKKAIKKWMDDEKKFEEVNSRTKVFELVAESLLDNVQGDNASGAGLLCFDEMQVVDVFTAVALAGIFSRLIKKGTVVVATSNRAPNDLNKDGLQKEMFDNFISDLQSHCHLVLLGTEKDYRRVLASDTIEKGKWQNYHWPLCRSSEILLEQNWQHFVSQAGGKVMSVTVPVMFGRTLEVPKSCNGVARFSFEQICDRPVGAADYIALASNFHTVFVTGIPSMSMRNRDKARRFITLVDELYNHRRQLICTAATSIDELFLGTEEGSLIDLESLQFETDVENSRLRRNVLLSGSVAPLGNTEEDKASIQFLVSGREELFAFQRAISRLIEMQTPIYLRAMDFHTQDKKFERKS